jgi:serine/threonine-protein kinase SRPK3
MESSHRAAAGCEALHTAAATRARLRSHRRGDTYRWVPSLLVYSSLIAVSNLVYLFAHADIKPDNMVQIKDLSIIDRYLEGTPTDPAVLNDPDVLPSSIQSRSFGNYYITGSVNDLDICLGDWGAAGWSSENRPTPVQPVLLRAPEVVISAPWGPAVDIWNLGAVLLELVDGVHMFDARNGRNGKYDVKKHVEEMVRLFGRLPRSLLDQGNRDVVARCFHDDGSVVEPEREGTARLEDWVENIDGEEKEAFIAFLRTVMVIDPEKRKRAAELVDEPWLLI